MHYQTSKSTKSLDFFVDNIQRFLETHNGRNNKKYLVLKADHISLTPTPSGEVSPRSDDVDNKENVGSTLKRKQSELKSAMANNKKLVQPGTDCDKFRSLDHDNAENRISALLKNWLLAITECNYEDLSALLLQSPQLINWHSCLHFCAKFGNEKVASLVLTKYKAELNSLDKFATLPIRRREKTPKNTPEFNSATLERNRKCATLCLDNYSSGFESPARLKASASLSRKASKAK
ncbi:hypothetical protein Ciccas_003333 [Cichlidogyrus casuarinus]|uniref:Uncharacterized protein n=1 Tax=Cichlidogyrus casuarinus TaxID=1844966 RepID=A0ABD2QF41_9PLAT